MEPTSGLRLSLRPSRLGAGIIFTAFIATAGLVAWLPGAALLRAAVVLSIGAYALVTMRRAAMRSAPRAIVGIELAFDRAVCLIERGGMRIDGRLQPDSYVSEWVTTLIVIPQGKRTARTVAILPDMLRGDDFRRLRVLMRLGQDPAKPADR